MLLNISGNVRAVRGGGLPQPEILKQECIDNRRISLQTHNLDFSADCGVQPSMFMFEFDSHDDLLCFLLFCALSIDHLYFYLSFNYFK